MQSPCGTRYITSHEAGSGVRVPRPLTPWAAGHLFTNSCAPACNSSRRAAYLEVPGRTTTIANRGLRPTLPSNPVTFAHREEPPCPAANSAAFRFAPPPLARWRSPPSRSRRCARGRRRDHSRRPPWTFRRPTVSRPSSSPAAVSGACRACSSTPPASSTRCPAMPAAARHRQLRDRQHRHHRPCRVRADQIRPEEDQLRQDPADLLLGRARSDPVEPPGSGQRHAISLGDLHHQRRAEEGRGRLYRAAQRRQGLQEADRDQGRAAGRVLSGGGLSSGLPDAAPEPTLYCL